jgi:spermidine synthase
MANFSKLLSYIWPQTRKSPSDFSGELEITLFRGKKVLDTQNANYSYGSLQKILEKALQNIDLSATKNILLLGMGAGSVIKSLRQKFAFQAHIDAVEIDAKIIALAAREFDVVATENTKIINDDAYSFLQKNKQEYDLIIIDIFIDTKVPEQFYSVEFAQLIERHLSSKASIIFNLGMTFDTNKNVTKFVQYFEQKAFFINILKKVERFNTVLIAQAK